MAKASSRRGQRGALRDPRYVLEVRVRTQAAETAGSDADRIYRALSDYFRTYGAPGIREDAPGVWSVRYLDPSFRRLFALGIKCARDPWLKGLIYPPTMTEPGFPTCRL